MRVQIVCIGLLLLSACAKPTAMTPGMSEDEIARERAHQAQYASSAGDSPYDKASYSAEQIKDMQGRLQHIVNFLAPHATKMCRELNGPQADCNMHIELSQSGKGVNAHADGEKIVIYPAMIDFAKSDTHLAFVLAHEYTHHFMRHVQAAKQNVMGGTLLGTAVDLLAASQGVSTNGQFGQFGAQAGLLTYSPAFEHEADYIGLYILARAGYNVTEAPQFWREMSRNNPDGIYNRTTHPTTPERFVSMEKTIAEINDKKSRGLPLLPNIAPQG